MATRVPDLSGNSPDVFERPARWLIQNDDATSPWSFWGGGQGVFTLIGTPASAVTTFQYAVDPDLTPTAVGTETTFSNAVGAGQFVLPRCMVRVLIGSATGSTNLSASIARF